MQLRPRRQALVPVATSASGLKHQGLVVGTGATPQTGQIPTP